LVHYDDQTFDATVPESIQHLLFLRSEPRHLLGQQVLEARSVAGGAFSAAVVAAGLETDVDLVEDRCESLVRRQLFLPVENAARRLAHREVIALLPQH
jgi:hypothetical protein